MATKRLPSIRTRAKLLALVFSVVGVVQGPVQADVIFSFEEDLQAWESGAGLTLSQSTFGATDGSFALLVENITSGFKNHIATTPNFGPTHPVLADAYNAFALAADVIAEGGTPRLEFDFSYDTTNVTTPGWIQLAIYVNSTSVDNVGGFLGYGTGAFLNGNIGTDWPYVHAGDATTDGVTLISLAENSYRVSVPLGLDKRMNLSKNSSFYDIGFQSSGGWEGTVDFAFDNFRFTGVPRFVEHTLFSWETPDDPGTPGINEQLEGWGPGLHSGHQLSVVTTGATDGNYALQVDATGMEENFSWGSRFNLTADGDPVIQAQINDLVTRVNGAAQLSFDVTYEDQFPLNPSWSQFYVYFADDSGAFYQAGTSSFNINGAAPGTQQTLTIDIDAFLDSTDPENVKNLAEEGLMLGTNSFSIGLGTSTDDGAVYQIDNFRLLTQVSDLLADFNNDLVVDGADLAIWEEAFGNTAAADADGDGVSDGHDFLIWQREYGAGMASLSASATAIPEPTSAFLAFIGSALCVFASRTRNTASRRVV